MDPRVERYLRADEDKSRGASTWGFPRCRHWQQEDHDQSESPKNHWPFTMQKHLRRVTSFVNGFKWIQTDDFPLPA